MAELDAVAAALEDAAGPLRAAGLSEAEIALILRGRLGGQVVGLPKDLFGIPVGATLTVGGRTWRRDPDGEGGQVRGHLEQLIAEGPPPGSVEWRRDREGRWPDPEPPTGPLVVPASVGEVVLPDDAARYPRAVDEAQSRAGGPYEPPAGPLIVDDRFPRPTGRAAELAEVPPGSVVRVSADGLPYLSADVRREAQTRHPAPPVDIPLDAPGEPGPGSVVTDNRTRVWHRDAEGRWWLAGATQPGTWADVHQARGGPEGTPQPGTPAVVVNNPRRAETPSVVVPVGSLSLPVQHAVLDDEGKQLLDPRGRPLLRTETETIQMSEVRPAAGP